LYKALIFWLALSFFVACSPVTTPTIDTSAIDSARATAEAVQADAEEKVSQAQDALATAQASGEEEIASLEATAKAAEAELENIKESLEQLEPTPTPVPEELLPLDVARISLSSKLNALDPTLPMVQPDLITQYLTSGILFRLNMDWTLKPELAEELEFSDDGLTATVTLREGLVYSDNTPLLAEDVVYAVDRQKNSSSLWTYYLDPVESVEAIDDRIIVFQLTQPYLDLGLALAQVGMTIHPKQKIESDPDYFLHPVSAGPYVITDWTPGLTEWFVEENPSYVFGPMAIKRIEFVSIPDLTSRVLQLSTGVVDYVYDAPIAAQDSFPPEVETYPISNVGVYHIAINHDLPSDHPLMNKDVRHAMSLAIDRHEINEKAFLGISAPVNGFLYEGVEQALPILPNNGERDLEAARELMAQTPFADGFEVTLQTWGQRPGWQDAALIIAENLADIGITAEVNPVEDAVAIANDLEGTYEMDFSGNSAGPTSFFDNLVNPGGIWQRIMRTDYPEVIELIEQSKTAKTVEEQTEIIHEIQRLLYEEMPWIPISERAVLIGNRVGSNILHEANLPPGNNPWVATLEEAQE
jgi:peptide/nickel transport system substrate-binding protein